MYLRMVPGRNSLLPLGSLAMAASLLIPAAQAFAAGGQSGSVKSSAARSTQGYLGVDVHDVSDDQASSSKVQGQQRGAEIVGMDHDGPACKAGMQVHDIILQMNGQAIDGEDQLRRILRETPAGKQATFLLSRDGQQRTISVQMANREDLERTAWENHYTVPEPDNSSPAFVPKRGNSFLHGSSASSILKESHSFLGTSMIVSSAYTGAKLELMGPQLAEFFGTQGSAGLLVRSVDPGSPASVAGIKAGDVVVKVNSQQVVNGNDWTKTIHENRGKSVEVVILRDRKEKSITMTPDTKKRSSVESKTGLEDFFGDSDQATQTRAALAELAPMFDAMAASMSQRMEDVRATPATLHLMAKLEMWSANPDFRHQIEIAHAQVHAAALASQKDFHSAEVIAQVDRLRMQMHDMMRLD